MSRPRKAQRAQIAFLCLLCLSSLSPAALAASNPTLLGKSQPGALVRVMADNGQITEVTADRHGSFRVEVSGRFHLEILHDGFRTLHSSDVSLPADSGDTYQIDAPLRPGNPGDVENV